MNDSQGFHPVRKQGILLHSGALLLVASASTALLLYTNAQENRGFFILYLIASLIVFVPFPFILYRLFALLRAMYMIDRDGFHIQWGLRSEDIPMDEIEWLRAASDLPVELPLPRLSVAGAVLGTQRSKDLGKLEFFASDLHKQILIACRNRILVITPQDQSDFMRVFKRYAELGSLAPIQAHSSNAEFLVTTILKDKYSRAFILGGLALTLLLLVLVSFLIPAYNSVTLGFNLRTNQLEQAPSERLLLLPVAAAFFFLTDLGFGSYLYRKQGLRWASYFTLASSMILPLSFLLLILIVVI